MAPRAKRIPVDANTANGPHPIPAGGAAHGVHGGIVEDIDPNTEVRGKLWYGDHATVGLGRQMQRDPMVRWGIAGWCAPVIAATWDVEAASDRALEVEAADFQFYNLFQNKVDWIGWLGRGTTGYTRDGTDVHELTDDTQAIPRDRFPNHPQPDNAIVYTGFHHRPRWSIDTWIQSKKNGAQISGFHQYVKGSDAEKPGTREVSFERGDLILRLTWDQEGANFDGFPQARSAWSPFKRKRIYEVISSIRHEREGVPIPELTEPPGGVAPAAAGTPEESERDVADEIAENLRSHEQAFLRLPDGWKFRWVPPNGADTGLRLDTDACDFAILFNFGLGFMKLGSGTAGRTGSWALGDVQRSHGVLTGRRQAAFLEHALNVGYDGFSPIQRSHLLNYGPNVGCPRVVIRYMPIGDAAALLSALPELAACGALTLDDVLEDNFVRPVLGAGARDPKSARPRPAVAKASRSSSSTTTDQEDARE